MQGNSLKALLDAHKFLEDNFTQFDSQEQNNALKKAMIKKDKTILHMAKKIQTLQNSLTSAKIAGPKSVGSKLLRQKLQDEIFRNNFSRDFLEDIRVKLKNIATKMQKNISRMKKSIAGSQKKSPLAKNKQCPVIERNVFRKSWDHNKVPEYFSGFQQKLEVDILNYIDIISQYTQKTEQTIFEEIYSKINNSGGRKLLGIGQQRLSQQPFKVKKESKQLLKERSNDLFNHQKALQNYKQLREQYQTNLLQLKKFKNYYQQGQQKIKILENLLKQSEKQKNSLLDKISNSISTKEVIELQQKQKKDIIKTLVFQKTKLKELQDQAKNVQRNDMQNYQIQLQTYTQMLKTFKDLKNQKIFKSSKGSRSPSKL